MITYFLISFLDIIDQALDDSIKESDDCSTDPIKRRIHPQHMNLTSTQCHEIYQLMEPEIEQFLEATNTNWWMLVDDPTAYTDQEAKEKAVEMFLMFVRSKLADLSSD